MRFKPVRHFITYWSASKGEYLNIEEMATPHLERALVKLEAELKREIAPGAKNGPAVLGALCEEIAWRKEKAS